MGQKLEDVILPQEQQVGRVCFSITARPRRNLLFFVAVASAALVRTLRGGKSFLEEIVTHHGVEKGP